MIMQIMIDLSQVLIWPTKRVSVPNLKSFVPTKIELRAKEVGEFSIMLYGKMGYGRSLAHHHGCRNINVWRFSKTERPYLLHLLVDRSGTCRSLSKWDYLHSVKILSKKSQIQFFDDVIANQ